MPDESGVVDKVVARLTLDVSPWQQQLKVAEDSFKQFSEQLKTAAFSSNALTSGPKLGGDVFIQGMDETIRTLKQQITELKTQFNEGLITAQNFYEKLNSLRGTYASSLDTNTDLGRSNDIALRQALVNAENEISRFEDFKMNADNRMLQNEMNTWIESERQYVNKLEQEEAAHEKSINDQLKLIKAYYDTKMSTAQNSLAKIEELMTQETEYFQTNVDKRIAAMKMQYQIQKDQATQAARDQAALYDSRSLNLGPLSNIGKYSMDIAGGMALFTIMSELTKIPQAAFDAQNSMVKLEQVLELGPSEADLQRYGNLNGILKDLEQTAEVMAQTYGVDVNKVIDAMSMIGRKYKDTADIVTLTDTALQMNAVDNVDVETSVKSLEAMMSQFHLTTGQAREALFQLTAAAHEFQTTGTDLMDAIERSGASFATLKMNTKESIAAISALAQMTAQSGSVIGNSWKSIEVSMTTDKGIKALKELGIAAFDANGNLKDGVTILQSLEKEWPKLSDQAKIHFAEVLAGGKFQYERLLTFLNDYTGQYQRALKAIGDANAKQQEELVATALTSPAKQWDMTKASMQSLSITIMSQLTPSLIGFMTDLRQGTQYVNDHWNSLEHWISTGAKLAEAYVSWRLALATYNALVKVSTSSQKDFNAALATTEAESSGFVGAMGKMGDSALVLAGKVAAATAKMAAMLAVFQSVSSMISSANDPLDAKMQLTQDKLNSVNKQISEAQDPRLRNFLPNLFDGTSFVANYFKDQGNFIRAWKDSRYTNSIRGDSLSQLQQQRNSLQKELSGLQGQKDKAQADEIKRSLDNMNKLIDDAQKNGGSQTGPLYGPPWVPSSGDYNPSTSGGSKKSKKSGSGNSSIAQQDNAEIDPYTNRIDNAALAVREWKDQMDLAKQALSANSDDTKAASQYAAAYGNEIVALNEHMLALNSQDGMLQTLIAHTKVGTSEYQTLTKKLFDNKDAIMQDQLQIGQLTDEWKKQNAQLIQMKFKDVTDEIKDATTEFKDELNNTQRTIQNYDKALQTADSDLSKHATDMKAAQTVVADYDSAIAQHQQHIAELTDENAKLSPELDKIKSEMSQVDASLKAGTITAEDHDSMLQNLQQQYDSLTQTIQQNQDAVQSDQEAMQSSSDNMRNQIISNLKTAYDEEKQIQELNLQNTYDAQTDSINQQKTAVDNLIKSLDQQWQSQQNLNKLQDLQNQLNQVESQHNHEYIDAQGKIQYTYDVTKATDLQKQIEDEQLTIQHDAEKQRLDDQKTALEQQQKQLTDNYNTQKSQLDQYWAYRTQQDQLEGEADNLILNNGLQTALGLTTSFSGQMVTQYDNITAAARQAAAAMAQTMGIQNASSTSMGPPAFSGTLNSPIMGGNHPVLAFAGGGQVPFNAGIQGVDSVPAMLTPGEYVVPEVSFDDIMSRMSMSSTTSNADYSIHIDHVSLPNVTNAQSFSDGMRGLAKGLYYHGKVG